MYDGYALALDTLGQEALRKEIAVERQRELAYQGHRWFDLRRTTQPKLIKVFEKADTISPDTLMLLQGDERYTLRFPSEALEANPGLENWK